MAGGAPGKLRTTSGEAPGGSSVEDCQGESVLLENIRERVILLGLTRTGWARRRGSRGKVEASNCEAVDQEADDQEADDQVATAG